LKGLPHSIPKANGDLWKVYDGEVIAKLSNEIITGSLPVRNFHGRRPVLCSATMPPVCRFTEFENSSSPSCFDARPSCEQSLQFFLGPGKTWHRALFDGRQSRLDHLIRNRHGVSPPEFAAPAPL